MNIILSKDLGFGAYSCQLPENHVDGVVTLVWEGEGEGKEPSKVQYGTKMVFFNIATSWLLRNTHLSGSLDENKITVRNKIRKIMYEDYVKWYRENDIESKYNSLA